MTNLFIEDPDNLEVLNESVLDTFSKKLNQGVNLLTSKTLPDSKAELTKRKEMVMESFSIFKRFRDMFEDYQEPNWEDDMEDIIPKYYRAIYTFLKVSKGDNPSTDELAGKLAKLAASSKLGYFGSMTIDKVSHPLFFNKNNKIIYSVGDTGFKVVYRITNITNILFWHVEELEEIAKRRNNGKLPEGWRKPSIKRGEE